MIDPFFTTRKQLEHWIMTNHQENERWRDYLWLVHWIMDLITDDFIVLKDFKNWIEGFEGRYSAIELDIIENAFKIHQMDIALNGYHSLV